LLKVKTFHDAEAIVVDHVPGAGKHKGRLGALVVEMPDGTRFNVGTGYSDKERESPPALGEIITYRYQELSDGGVPRFPTYVGVRIDAAWTGQKPKKSAPVVSLPSPAPSSSAAARYFELVDGKSSKFWEIKLDGSSVTTRYGRIGASGQSTTKDHGSAAAAQTEHAKLVTEKTKKGYAER
jgi:DNA ligase-1